MNNIIIDNRKKNRNINIKKSNLARIPSNKYNKVVVGLDEIKSILGKNVSPKRILKDNSLCFPTYVYPFIMQANNVSGACKAKNLGKLHCLMRQKRFKSLSEWRKWYSENYPDSINKATDKIYDTIIKSYKNMTNNNCSIGKVGLKRLKKYCRIFVENLVFDKTFAGLKIQEVILTKLSQMMNKKYVWSNAKDDSSGIDGYIGKIPVSIKPQSCKIAKKAGVKRIIYTVKNNYLCFIHTL